MRTSVYKVLVAIAASLAGAVHAFGVGLPQYGSVMEFVNDSTGHYFITANGEEMSAVLQGRAGAGWRRTGYNFTFRTFPEYPPDIPRADVCRFYAPSVNSHFYTANPAECATLRNVDLGWFYEGIAFRAVVPSGGACAAGFQPVYRLYNNRWMFKDSNHRFTSDDRVRRRHVASGWSDEGIAFCSEPTERRIEKAYWTSVTDPFPGTECAAAAHEIHSCLVLRSLPPIARSIDKNVNPANPYEVNPQYSESWDRITGWQAWWGRLLTVEPSADPQRVASSTFLQLVPIGAYSWATTLGAFTLHLDSRQRTGGDLAGVSLITRFATTTLLLGQPADGPLFPWRDGRDTDVFVGMGFGPVPLLRRFDADAHFYALPIVRFRDMASGRMLMLTLQTIGTVAAGDFVVYDPVSRATTVSTSFSDRPAFGTAVRGRFVWCQFSESAAPCPGAASGLFRFRIGVDDFRDVLRLARAVDPALSDDPANYRIEEMECRAESYRGVEASISLGNCALELTY